MGRRPQNASVGAGDDVTAATRLLRPERQLQVRRPPWGGPAAAAGNGQAKTSIVRLAARKPSSVGLRAADLAPEKHPIRRVGRLVDVGIAEAIEKLLEIGLLAGLESRRG